MNYFIGVCVSKVCNVMQSQKAVSKSIKKNVYYLTANTYENYLLLDLTQLYWSTQQ